ncbi:MAG: lipid carrier--UDP-N-acetylgalactosaminyltransferase [Planctomyces sp.]|nr:lipid carrier--UDP-N-acetylgalactosaminyltransferase [Planctomyces sp.]
MKRAFDLALALAAGILLLPLMVTIACLVRLTSRGPALYWSNRVGRDNQIFQMPKFRSMRIDTPVVATHLLTDSRSWITPVGRFLRKTSLDELPQLWSILRGDMSFVGPRPALFNQDDLVAARTVSGVHHLPPGLTGWAQVNGRDELSIPEKVAFDAEYRRRQSLWFDVRILVMTAGKVLLSDGVRQADELPARKAA